MQSALNSAAAWGGTNCDWIHRRGPWTLLRQNKHTQINLLCIAKLADSQHAVKFQCSIWNNSNTVWFPRAAFNASFALLFCGKKRGRARLVKKLSPPREQAPVSSRENAHESWIPIMLMASVNQYANKFRVWILQPPRCERARSSDADHMPKTGARKHFICMWFVLHVPSHCVSCSRAGKRQGFTKMPLNNLIFQIMEVIGRRKFDSLLNHSL